MIERSTDAPPSSSAPFYRPVNATDKTPCRATLDLRFWGLLAAGGICGSRAIVYGFTSREPLPEGLRYVFPGGIPLVIYALLWAATAGLLFLTALLRIRLKGWQALSVGMPLAWGTLYAVGAFTGPPGEPFVMAFGSAWTWWFIGLLIMVVVLTPPTRR